MSKNALRNQILHNAEEIRRLKDRVRETFNSRNLGPDQRAEWQKACEEFHRHYDALAFPGGYEGAFERLGAGDTKTIEAALCFLECRPRFFRSGYMFAKLLRKLRKAPMTEGQAEDFREIEAKVTEWRRRRSAAHRSPNRPLG